MRNETTVIAREIEEREPYLLKEYDSIIQEQRKNGIVEIVPENEDQMLDDPKLNLTRNEFTTRHITLLWEEIAKRRKLESFTMALQGGTIP